MTLTRKFLGIMVVCFALAPGLMSCSMYRNAGRKNFEASTPGQINSMTLSSRQTSACWQQSATEPLWQDVMDNMDPRRSLTVRKLNNSEIEVCFSASPGENNEF